MMMMGYVVRSVCYDAIVIDVRSMSCRPSKKIEYFKYDVSSKILINQNNNRKEDRGGEGREGREQWKLGEVFLTKKNVNILSGLFPFVSFKARKVLWLSNFSSPINLCFSLYLLVWDSHRVDGTCVTFARSKCFQGRRIRGNVAAVSEARLYWKSTVQSSGV